MSKEDFGKWLRLLRIRNGLSQTDLAKELDVDQTTVSRLERGAQGMSGPLAAAIARVFNLQVDEVWAVADPEVIGGAERDDAGNVYITPPPATARTNTARRSSRRMNCPK